MDLRKGLRSLGLETSGARVEKLERFIAEINLWNPRYGLVAAGVIENDGWRHVDRIELEFRVADGKDDVGVLIEIW